MNGIVANDSKVVQSFDYVVARQKLNETVDFVAKIPTVDTLLIANSFN
jgi:hypothetical protein